MNTVLHLYHLYQEDLGIKCNAVIDGYTNFVFLNRFGDTLNYGLLNKALKRIVRDCNAEIMATSKQKNPLLLPRIHNHILWHSFCTNLISEGISPRYVAMLAGDTVETIMASYVGASKTDEEKALIIGL